MTNLGAKAWGFLKSFCSHEKVAGATYICYKIMFFPFFFLYNKNDYQLPISFARKEINSAK